MEVKASLNYVRISPRKVRLVANEIRGFDYLETRNVLQHIPNKAAGLLSGLLKSAYSNAKFINTNIKEEDLYLKKLYVDEGPVWKRVSPRARGRADRYVRRTSKITIVLSDDGIASSAEKEEKEEKKENNK